MIIAACVKFTPDANDIQSRADGSISLERAEWIIGGFDLQAVETAARLAESTTGKAIAIAAGPHQFDNSKLKKDLLSRGIDELVLVVDDALANADTNMTAAVLAQAVRKIGAIDLVLCGEGSADLYFQQVGLQLGEMLEYPTLNAISAIEVEGSGLLVQRTLEDEIDVLEVPMPAVLSVTTDINQPRLPTMKEILKAGKKPITQWSLADLGLASSVQPQIEVLSTKVPPQVQRKKIMLSGTAEEQVQALVSHFSKEGLI